jgi:hypothetical protein
MQALPEVRTDNTNDSDRHLMRTVLRKPLVRKLSIYLPAVLLGITGLIIINMNDVRFDINEGPRGFWNVTLVLLAALPLRLAIGDLMSYSKDLGNYQVKIAKGLVSRVSGKTIAIGKYEFHTAAVEGKGLQVGDAVELRAGYKTGNVFWLKKG